MNLARKMNFAKFAVIGDPIEHSLSPLMHNAAFKFLNINANYEAIHLKTSELANFAKKARAAYDGVNVTVPHKGQIIDYLDEISPIAKFANSVNTIINKDGKLLGESTDGKGLEMAIKNEFNLSSIRGKDFFFIGCGGACRAVSVYFASSGAKSLSFINRTLSKAESLCELISREFSGVEVSFSDMNDEKFIVEAVEKADIIVQASSLGLKNTDKSPLTENLFIKGKFYYDMIYANTSFLRFAQQHDCLCADGLSMLVYQGAESFKLWTGKDAPIQIMKNALISTKRT